MAQEPRPASEAQKFERPLPERQPDRTPEKVDSTSDLKKMVKLMEAAGCTDEFVLYGYQGFKLTWGDLRKLLK